MKPTRPVWLILDFALLILLAAWVIGWPDWSPPDPGPRVELPLVGHGFEPHGECDPREPAFVTIDAGGVVFVGEVSGDPGSLGRLLVPYVRDLERHCRERGDTPTEDLPGGGRASKLEVLLRVDRRTRWRSVPPVLVRVGAAGLFRVKFAVRRCDGWWNRLRTELPAYLPAPPRNDDSVAYLRESCGPSAPDLAELRRRATEWFHANREREHVRLVVELQPHPDTPFDHVAHVLEVLLDAGLEKIDFVDANGVRAVVVPR